MIPPGIHTIRGVMGVCHLLVDAHRDAVLLDTGLIGERWHIPWRMRRLGLKPDAIKAILITHGHLDHAGNLAWAKEWSGAPVHSHPAEQPYIDGTFPYAGTNIWCGRLERAGRAVLRVGRPAAIDVRLADGDELPFCGGLRVMHLPGHTLGHCGFYSPTHDLLFSGDLFSSYFFNVHQPPPILNSAPELIPETLEKVKRLKPRLMVPRHYDILDGAPHRRRFDRLLEKQAHRAARRAG